MTMTGVFKSCETLCRNFRSSSSAILKASFISFIAIANLPISSLLLISSSLFHSLFATRFVYASSFFNGLAILLAINFEMGKLNRVTSKAMKMILSMSSRSSVFV
ncbi:hypothetical protein D3C81_1495800 [compost metagenome]